jgi:uncharacterized membrane protein
MRKYEPHRSSLGMDANLLALLVWVGGTILAWMNLGVLSPLVPIVIMYVEKDSSMVRYHAVQATALMIFTALANFVLAITIIGIIFIPIVNIILLIFSLIAAIRAWHYETYALPFVQGIVHWLVNILHIDID